MCIYMCFTCAFQLCVHFFLHGPFEVPCAGTVAGYFISITTQQWQMGREEIIEAFFIFWESIGNNLIFPVVTIAAATKSHVIVIFGLSSTWLMA